MKYIIRSNETIKINIISTMDHSSSFPKKLSGPAKLCQDIATLINNRQGSDIQFKVGGGVQGNDETVCDESAIVTLYAHSVILRCRSRYFATMLDEDKHWKESFSGVIYKPNISPSTFQDVLHYIYTGNVPAKSLENIIELITAAEEMDLEELSTECQTELVRTVKYIFTDEDDSDDDNEFREISEFPTRPRIPIDEAIHTHIIPALNLSSNHSLSHLSDNLLTIILPRLSVIIESPNAYTTFISEISSEALSKIISSDNLAMTERSVWDMVLSWGCYQTNLSKSAVESFLTNSEEEEGEGGESLDGTLISSAQLNELKIKIAPLLPYIRFSLLDSDDYNHIYDIVNYFLSRRRSSELTHFFLNPDGAGLLDMPRNEATGQKPSSRIIIEPAAWQLLRNNIFETGGIAGCPSLRHLKFDLLFRASKNGFLAAAFHQYCDNKGPTLTLVRSDDGHLFGGVKFCHWKSDGTCISSPLDFLFALPDGRHRKDAAIFKIEDQAQVRYSSYNYPAYGPTFGFGFDLYIADCANINLYSYSCLPTSYNGIGASNTALAGAYHFAVSEYEVFAISSNAFKIR